MVGREDIREWTKCSQLLGSFWVEIVSGGGRGESEKRGKKGMFEWKMRGTPKSDRIRYLHIRMVFEQLRNGLSQKKHRMGDQGAL